ncbi:MAG: hypothetical protein Q9185_003955 [Variospora sp. 1 TL-2023]
MTLLGDQYASSDEETRISETQLVVAAPDVSLQANPTNAALDYGPARPEQGPLNPYKSTQGSSFKRKNALTGNAQEVAISDATFSTHHRTFQSLGYTMDPSGSGAYVGDLTRALRVRDDPPTSPSKRMDSVYRRKRQKRGDASIVDGEGAYKGPWARFQEDEDTLGEAELSSEEEYLEEAIVPARSSAVTKLASDYQEDLTNTETTQFHGTSPLDYQNRTYMHVPQDLDIDLRAELGSTQNYHPKKLIHTWKSHTKAINALRFFPNFGHLLLSASADTKVKLWDVYHSRSLLRTYSGHTKSVTDTTFSPSGTHFLTGSYDRHMKLWDTETGACISRFQTSTKAVPHVLRFYPSTDTHEFLVGTSDKKIVQFDTRSGEMTQEYDHHLQAVNTITFCDENRRFITTSDDRSLRAWEYNIPVPIKYIAEPHLFSLVRATPHPNGKSVAFQSADNQIVVYASTDRFRQNRKKSFRGHNTAGYAIDVSISPDGQFLMSGDSSGFVCFWDFKSCKMWHKIQAHEGATVCAQWHPKESSKVATAGLDGAIKYWD